MKLALSVILGIRVAFALGSVAIAVLLLLGFSTPFESVCVALLVMIVNHVFANSIGAERANKDLAQRLGVPEEKDEPEIRRADAIAVFMDMIVVIIVDLAVVAAIIKSLLTVYGISV